MKLSNILYTGILLLLVQGDAISSDNYKQGDELYVWARSGLRLRSEPGTKSPIITTLTFGDKVKVIDKTDVTFNFDLIQGADNNPHANKVDPVILYGHWVEVVIDSNVMGYVIDQYLLPIVPNKPANENEWELKLISQDTVFKNPVMEDGSGLNMTIKKTYQDNISSLELFGGSWFGKTFTLPGFTIEEVLIIFGNYADHVVLTNLANEIVIYDGATCTITIKHINGITTSHIDCAC